MKDFSEEIIFKTARSGGKGGQNVNKVETMVEARWLMWASQVFNKEEKERLFLALGKKLTADGFLLVKSSLSRSQLENKQDAIQKILELVNKALIPKRIRVATRPSKASIQKRITQKKMISTKKQNRRKDWD
ncbi:MAG TPA: alternative ribosome rescue aminoacyl-tRNA hydrolase ArfB [Edaphocola sp.]|nr:alternative ribosome rescue aminoacyl-tRNA hydrolase ArfB [Edaphocola sp.]